jgi:AraC-like DNA-binding protein
MNNIQLFPILFAIEVRAMPQIHRIVGVVPIEFEAQENLETLPLAGHVSIILLASGKANLFLNEKAVTLTAPSVLLISQYDRIKSIETLRHTAKSFSFNPTFLNSSLTFDRLKTNDVFAVADQHDRCLINLFLHRDEYYDGTLALPAKTYIRVSEWLSLMGTEVFAHSDDYWPCRIRGNLLQTLYLLDDIFIKRKTPDTAKKEKFPVDILLEYIHVNYADDISLESLCEFVHINRTTLNRNFKEQTGYTAMEYLLRYRIKIACDTLYHTTLSLAEIAEATGFNYDTYFIKQFTAKMGESPTEYRKKVGWAAAM